MIQYLLVHAYKAGKLNDIKSFFADCGDRLMCGPDAEQLSAWFVLPYISNPSSHHTFQVPVLPIWMTASICMSHLSHPTLLATTLRQEAAR